MGDTVRFATDSWVAAILEAINNSVAYREAASKWEGDFCFVIEGDSKGSGAEVVVYLDLWHGVCRVAELVTAESPRTPEFYLRGPRKNWAKVLRKQIDPIKALMTHSLRLTGNLAKVLRNVKSAQELVNAAASVNTEF